MISFFTSVSSGTVFPRGSWSSAAPRRRPARVRVIRAAAGKARAELPGTKVGKPHEGAASRARYFGRELGYHAGQGELPSRNYLARQANGKLTRKALAAGIPLAVR